MLDVGVVGEEGGVMEGVVSDSGGGDGASVSGTEDPAMVDIS